MKDAYELEIPALLEVLSQEDIAGCEVFIVSGEKRCERIQFHVADDEACYTYKNIGKRDGNSASVQIDFGKKKISILQEGTGSETVNGLRRPSSPHLFLTLEKDRIQFLTFLGKPPSNGLDIRM